MKTGILIILIGLTAINLNAQNNLFDGYEIGLNGSAGLSALHFTTADGSKPSYSAGYAFGWDIAMIWNDFWSFRTGVNMTSYHASVSFKQKETRNLITTPAGLPTNSHFYMEAKYRGYEEQHKVLYLRIPLMAQYRMPTGVNHYYYVSAGLQTGIRANATCFIHSDEIVTKGYSEYTMQYYENMSVHGFDLYSNIKSTGKTNLGIAFSGALETGLIWKLKNEMALYTGVFLDCALNDIRKGNPEKEPVVYSETGVHTFNSIINSQNDGKPMTDQVHPVAVGLRLRWSMRFDR